MRYHGLYFVSNPGAQLPASLDFVKAIVSGIESSYPRADKAGAWVLNHRVLRDVPPYSETPQTDHVHSYQHLLHVSTISPDRTYNLIQHPASDAIAAIPLSQTDTHFSFLVNQMPLLWSPQRMLEVVNGKTYQAGDFLIYVGELRSRRQVQASSISSPGIVVCISTHAGGPDDEADGSPLPADEDPVGFERVEESIRELWYTIRKEIAFGRSEIREHMQLAQGFGRDEEQAREAVVRMWCEALSPRA